MAGGLSTCIRGEKPYQKRHPFLPLLYHIIRRVSNWFVTRFFICGQHYLYREEEIKAKPPSIAKWLAAYPLASEGRSRTKSVIPSCRYYIIPYDGYQLGLSLVFLYAANTICTGKGLTSYPLTYHHSAALSPRHLRSTRARLPCRAPPVYAVRPAPQTCAPGGETR